MSGGITSQVSSSEDDDNVNIWDFIAILKKRALGMTAITVLLTGLSIAYAFSLPKIYQSKAVLMPVNEKKAINPLAQLSGNMSGLAGIALGTNWETAKLIALMQSNTLARKVLEKINLNDFFFPDSWDETRNDWKPDAMQPKEPEIVKSLKDSINATIDDFTGTLIVTSEFTDPEIAANVLRIYIDELQKYVQVNDLTTTQRHRKFLEKQYKTYKMKLLELNKALASFYKEHKVPNQLSVIDVDLTSEFASEGEEGNNNASQSDQKNEFIIENFPADIYLHYVNSQKTLMEGIAASLYEQLNLAGIEVEKNNLAFHVIDPPEVPHKKFKPNKKLIAIAGLILGVFISLFYAFASNAIENNRRAR